MPHIPLIVPTGSTVLMPVFCLLSVPSTILLSPCQLLESAFQKFMSPQNYEADAIYSKTRGFWVKKEIPSDCSIIF